MCLSEAKGMDINMKYANLKHNGLAFDRENRIVNLGDAFEIIAIDQIYKRMGIPKEEIIYIDLYQLDSYEGEEVVLPINFMLSPYAMGKDMLKFSDKITPVFLGVTFSDTKLSREQLDVLKRWEPIGCRDERTRDLLHKYDIQAYIGGCLVSTIEYDNIECKDKSKVVFIDVPRFVEPYISDEIKNNIEFTDHELYLSYEQVEHDNSAKNRAKNQIKFYAEEAKMIVTSRFHGAVIGLALGIPVILVAENNFYKFSWLSKLLPFYDHKTANQINWCPQAVEMTAIKEKMIQLAISRIQNAVMLKKTAEELDSVLSNKERSDKEALLYISGAKKYIDTNWKREDSIRYALWGINSNATELYRYIQNKFPNAELAAVYDGLREIEFEGIKSQYPCAKTIEKNVFIFVTSNTAKKPALELFQNIDKRNYFLCCLEFIKSIGEM